MFNFSKTDAEHITSLCEKHSLPAPRVGEPGWQAKVIGLINFLDAQASINLKCRTENQKDVSDT